jgi:hypothetical protein
MKTLNNFFRIISALIFLCILNGCATIVNGTSQRISVETTPIPGASCSLSNDKGKWIIPYTPSYLIIHRSSQNLFVQCSKQGFSQAALEVNPNLNPLVLGNIFLAGLIGIGVDLFDGAAYDYPKDINVPLAMNYRRQYSRE